VRAGLRCPFSLVCSDPFSADGSHRGSARPSELTDTVFEVLQCRMRGFCKARRDQLRWERV